MKEKMFEIPSNPIAPNEVNSNSVSFVGAHPATGEVRAQLSHLELDMYNDNMADIGDVISPHKDHIDKVLIDLSNTEHHTPFLVCDDSNINLSDAIVSNFAKPVFVANRPVLTDEHYHIGIQKHYVGPLFDIDINKHIRLGEVRSNLQSAEVILRTADYVSINLNVLRCSDNLGNEESNTAGLSIEELCMIAKYAGASTQIKAISVLGFNHNRDIHHMMSKNIALIFWYFLDGVLLRKQELTSENIVKSYTVFTEDLENELLFTENSNTGRWWVRIHSDDANEIVEFACTKNDYELACKNEISERLMSLMAKI